MDTDSFDQIYENLLPLVYRFVRLRVPTHDVEDVTAEILTKVWCALPGFKGNASLKSWALRIAYHQIADYYRMNRGKGLPVISLSHDLMNSPVAEDQSELLTTLLSISETLAKMSEPQVAVIQLRLIEGFSAAEVSQTLGITQQAVDSLLYRAKKSFCKHYRMDHAGGKR
ncbi:sigma-70 family RNA polymerase sigma factor [Desulfitobacterium sp.]|uniref:RNA polymerase sigma factor n=1 Tax=Desulfitobacterium sp. TaxID=49981 RepID=UPI002D08B515|nr:sigma-70 family RNA polymerase sigma factor [Desulfitobacterium sp.]HVJ48547.1 sigma-70 family RNA polymerase sigma factor [Desulfitobacterium sp.]